MKNLIWAFVAVIALNGCQKNKEDAISDANNELAKDSITPVAESKPVEKTLNPLQMQYADVALKFINAYKEDCDNLHNRKGARVFVSESPYLTSGFKSELKRILDEADKEDPEMGLGFDPIFDAQDYPDQGFEIKSVDEKTGYVEVRGKDWKEFVLVLKVVNDEGKWLVDGCGIVNIPQDKKAER